MMNVVIPMAGSGARFAQAGYAKPKPFIDVLGRPVILSLIHIFSIVLTVLVFVSGLWYFRTTERTFADFI